MTIVTGAFAMVVGGRFVVSGDAAAPRPISWRRSRYFVGVAANLIATACYVAATLLVYDLLKPVSRNLSLLAPSSVSWDAPRAISFVLDLAPWSSWEGPVPERIHDGAAAGTGLHVSQTARTGLHRRLLILRPPLPPDRLPHSEVDLPFLELWVR